MGHSYSRLSLREPSEISLHGAWLAEAMIAAGAATPMFGIEQSKEFFRVAPPGAGQGACACTRRRRTREGKVWRINHPHPVSPTPNH